MLNRLMFVYFIQRRGFLDGNPDYLVDRLRAVREAAGKGKFHNFYRQFLRRLFHEGLGQPKNERKSDLSGLIGDVPYLNGGLFEVHALEEANPSIDIPDEAFERLFAFFDGWDWHLDDRLEMTRFRGHDLSCQGGGTDHVQIPSALCPGISATDR
ncbi:hypothetical protein [Burkholderia pseudomallei]|uniref:type IIG restriction enzyme/methyltransferase n=1 Tax=Burkholderia pseudomallei TaxID=28450 RepID=UPI0012FDBD34|nr:hypothetical protein [Burkholderia pseudomallei]